MRIGSFLERLKARWQPKPINPPAVDPDIERLDPLQRSAESLRYSIMSIEFWISPKGQVREWLRHNTHLAAWLAIPAFIIIPIITFVLWQLVKWLAMLNSIAAHLLILPILTLLAAGMIGAVIVLARLILGK